MHEDFDRRIEQTLDHVAQSTRAKSRVDEITTRHRSASPVLRIGIAFAAVALAVGVPILFFGGGTAPSGSPVGSGDEANAPPSLVDTDEVEVTAEHEAVTTTTHGEPDTSEADPEDLPPRWVLSMAVDDPEVIYEVAADGSGSVWLGSNDTVCLLSVTGTGSSGRLPDAGDGSGEPRPGPGDDGVSVQGPGAVSLGEPITEDSLIEWCSQYGSRAAQVPSTYTVCMGAYLSDHLMDTDGLTPQLGPVFPVVLAWESDCVETLETLPVITLFDADDGEGLERLNSVRQVEIAVIGISVRECLSVEEAYQLGAAIVLALGPQWALRPSSPEGHTVEGRFAIPSGETERAGCYTAHMYNQHGLVTAPSPTWDTDTSGTVVTIPPDYEPPPLP